MFTSHPITISNNSTVPFKPTNQPLSYHHPHTNIKSTELLCAFCNFNHRYAERNYHCHTILCRCASLHCEAPSVEMDHHTRHHLPVAVCYRHLLLLENRKLYGGVYAATLRNSEMAQQHPGWLAKIFLYPRPNHHPLYFAALLFFVVQIYFPHHRLARVCLPQRKNGEHHGRKRFSFQFP